MKKLLIILFALMPLYAANCDTDINVTAGAEISDNDIITVEQLLAREPDATECATRIFADALAQRIADIPEDTPESDIEKLIYTTFASSDTLTQVVKCPEIANADEMDDIKFLPIKYTFPGGREIAVNYETQPKILKQRLLMANKTSLPGDDDPSPRLGDLGDTNIWTNTDPAWYGIIVTQAGALRQFVGDGNNNTISLRYIEDNIDTMMPQSKQCTSGSALADDDENINLALARTTQDKSQDYYVSGDVNLQWISYLEIGLDVVITVVTFGGGAVISGVTKAARAARVMHDLSTGMRALAKTASVTKYIKLSQKYSQIAKRIAQLEKLHNAKTVNQYVKTNNNMRKLLRERNALSASDPKYAKVSENYLKAQAEWTELMGKNPELGREIANLSDMEDIATEMRNMEKAHKEVKQYQEASKAFADLSKYRRALRLKKLPAQRGNVVSRTLKSIKDTGRYIKNANTGGRKIAKANDVAKKTIKVANKTLKSEAKAAQAAEKAKQAAQTASAANKTSKITRAINGLKTIFGGGEKVEYARASLKGGRLRNWLFHSSMKNAGKLARLEESAGLLYGAIKFAGDMYDWSETSTGNYTSDIEFKPLLLLSADDIDGQDNVVNHGMWLLWQGDTYSASDDDAAYLQAMDFAEKFYRDLLDVQSETNDNSCDVDIYVVRPIIRNPGDDNAELYYLIMNDVPWSTHQE